MKYLIHYNLCSCLIQIEYLVFLISLLWLIFIGFSFLVELKFVFSHFNHEWIFTNRRLFQRLIYKNSSETNRLAFLSFSRKLAFYWLLTLILLSPFLALTNHWQLFFHSVMIFNPLFFYTIIFFVQSFLFIYLWVHHKVFHELIVYRILKVKVLNLHYFFRLS